MRLRRTFRSLATAVGQVHSMPDPDHVSHQVRPDELPNLRQSLLTANVAFAMPTYGEGIGIAAALEALHHAKQYVGLADAPILVSDSSPTADAVDTARNWAESSGADVQIDRSATRRSLKQALNAIFEITAADILVVTVADVVVTPQGLADLLAPLVGDKPPDVVIGASLPEGNLRSIAQRGGAWQTRAVWRAMAALPKSQIRTDGAFWAMSRRFISGYRFPIEAGLIADDAELARTLRAGLYHSVSVNSAIAYRLPPGNFRDFRASLVRSRLANPEHRRFTTEYPAAIAEAISDPLGALCYAIMRLATRVSTSAGSPITETWQPETSTKRKM